MGSSTIGQFLHDADPVYERTGFDIDTASESEGGEAAIIAGKTRLAGIARRPRSETLAAGVNATLIGHDAIAVIVHARNAVQDLTTRQLRRVFSGQVVNWRELGGPDLPIHPFVVGSESATRWVFKDAVMPDLDYAGVQEIRPDGRIVEAVATDPGGIGHISFSFLQDSPGVRCVAVEGQEPSVTNFDYPISRPLYLLWRPGSESIRRFIAWTQSEEGQTVVMNRFVGIRAVGSFRAGQPEIEAPTGTLIVVTEAYPVLDGGIYYHPHRSYDVLTTRGTLVRGVRNHSSENDENPSRVRLQPGTYLIRPKTSGKDRPEFYVTIERNRTTKVNVADLTRRASRHP